MSSTDDIARLLKYLRSLGQLREASNDYILSLLKAYNREYGKNLRRYQDLAEEMLKENTLEHVLDYAKEILPPKLYTTFRAGIGVPGVTQEEAQVKDFMQPLPKDRLFSATSTVADLKQFFGKAEFRRHFVVIHEGTDELRGIVSVSDYFPNKIEIESIPQETLVTKLKFFHSKLETIKDTDTMDVAQQKFDKNPNITYLFVVDEAKFPVGLLGEEELEKWKSSKLD